MEQIQSNCAMTETKLNTVWVLWHHDINNPNYQLSDYNQLLKIETVEDFWIAFNQIRDVYNSMFFLMREKIAIGAIWEDPKNKNGALGSLKFINQKHTKYGLIWPLQS